MKFTASALKEKLDARKWRERGGGMIARATYHTRRIDVKSVGTDFRRLRFIHAAPAAAASLLLSVPPRSRSFYVCRNAGKLQSPVA